MHFVKIYKEPDECDRVITELLHKIQSHGVNNKPMAVKAMTNFTRAVEKLDMRHFFSNVVWQEFNEKITSFKAIPF